jgi:hypothetical protein
MRLYLHEASQVQVQGEVSLHKAKGGFSPSFFRDFFWGGGDAAGVGLCVWSCVRGLACWGLSLYFLAMGSLAGKREGGREGVWRL